MPKDLWKNAATKDAARRARRPESDNLCTWEDHVRGVQPVRTVTVDERLRWVRWINRTWRKIKDK